MCITMWILDLIFLKSQFSISILHLSLCATLISKWKRKVYYM
jgi:hypothetical protein